MLFGIDGVDAHAEDGWVGRRVAFGDAVVAVRGLVGRCAVTSQNPDTGVPDLDTLRTIRRLPRPTSRATSRCRSASGAASTCLDASVSATAVEAL